MASPLFRWSLETPKCHRTDSEETFFESEKDRMNEPNSQTEDVLARAEGQIPLKKDPTSSSQETPLNGISQRNYFPESTDSTLSNIDFVAQDFPVKEYSSTFAHERKSDIDSGTEDFNNQWQMSVDVPVQDEVVPFSQSRTFTRENGQIDVLCQDKFNNSSDATFFESEEKPVNQQTAATLSDKCDANIRGNFEVLTGLTDSQFNTYRIENESASSDDTFFDVKTKIAEPVERQASQEEKSFNRNSTDHDFDVYPQSSSSVNGSSVPGQNVNAGKLDCVITGQETGLNELSQDILELMEDYPTDPVFNMADFDYFLRLLSIGTSPNSNATGTDHNGSNVLTESGMENAMVQLSLSSPQNISNSEQTEGSKEASRVVTGQKRVLSPPCATKNKKRRTTEITPRQPIRPAGKPPKSLKKKTTPLASHHQMILRRKKIQPTEEVPECSIPSLDPGCLISSNSVEKENIPPKTSKSKRKQAPFNDPLKQRMRIPNTCKNICSGTVRGQNGRTRGQAKKMTELNSDSLIQDSRAACNKNKRPVGKYLKRGSSEPVAETYPRTPGRASSAKTRNKVHETIIGRSGAELSQDREYLLSVRNKLLDIIFDETPVSKEEAENFHRGVTERHQRFLQWNQPGFCDKKVRLQVEDLIELSEKLQHQIKGLVGNSSNGEGRNETFSKSYCVSQPDNFRVPSSQPKKRVGRENVQAEVKVVSKQNNLKRAFGPVGEGKLVSASQKSNLGSDQPEFSRVLQTGTSEIISRPHPLSSVSSPHLREDILSEQCNGPSDVKNGSEEEEDFVVVRSTEENIPTGSCAHICACTSLPKTVIDCGSNTDFVEPPKQKRIRKKVVDRETNTDPECFDRKYQKKVFVDCGTNTEFYFSVDWKASSKGDRKVPDANNKENVEPMVDLKNIQGIWLPRSEDYAPSSYDLLLNDIFANPKAEFPQDLIDDLTWE